MYKRKNSFFNFCFSLLPGAGQMYQGFLKRGVSFMAMFFGVFAISALTHIDILAFIIPVIWFAAFFDSLNRNSLSDAQREHLKDQYIFIDESEFPEVKLEKYRVPAACVLIFIGVYALLRSVGRTLMDMSLIPENVYWQIDGYVSYLPKFLVMILFIALGVYLIRGKKSELLHKEVGFIEEKEEND